MAFADSTALIDHPDALRERARADGYLFFRGLLPPATPRALRAKLESLCERHGFGQQPPVLADGSLDAERMGAYYAQAYCLRDVHALPKHERIIELASVLFGRRAVPHARTVLRTLPTQTRHIWPPHQDFVNVATHDEVWNVWVPIGDCPGDLGPVSILAGSHRAGVTPLHLTDNGLVGNHPPEGHAWLSDDLESGDVLMFNALTTHRGQPNLRPDSLRMSVDNCIQPIDTPFLASAFDLHRGDLGDFNAGRDWEDIYRDWPADDPLKYYWRRLDLEWTPPLDPEALDRAAP